MGTLLDFDKHLKHDDGIDGYANTYLGMAHVSGSGPRGTSCRTCSHWGNRDGSEVGYYSNSDKKRAGCLREGYCKYPIPGKADKRFPHFARSCKFYERNDTPPTPAKQRED